MKKIKLFSFLIIIIALLLLLVLIYNKSNDIPRENNLNQINHMKPRIAGNTVYARDFGVKADANYYNSENGKYYIDSDFKKPSTDDTKAINKAIGYAKFKNANNIYIPKGNYLINPEGVKKSYEFEYAINGGIKLESNTNLIMSDEANLVINTVYKSGYSLINVDGKENVNIQGGNLVGDMNTHPYDTHNYCHGITISNGSSGVTVKDIDITHMEDDGIMIADYLEHLSDGKKTNHVEIRNIKSHNNGRQGITISTGSNIVVVDSEFSNQRKHSPMSGIDIELESFDHGGVKDIEITGNIFENNEYSGIVLSDMFEEKPNTTSENVNLSENTISGSRFGIIIAGKVNKMDIFNNDVYIDHLKNEFSAGIGNTSKYSTNVSIYNNNIISYLNTYSIGIVNTPPLTVIKGNTVTGQREAIRVNDNGAIISGNIIK